MRPDHPLVAPLVRHAAHPVAVEHVLGLAAALGAGGDCGLEHGVDVVDVEQSVELPHRMVGRTRIRQHQHGVADAHLGVADPSARRRHPESLLRAERLLEELDELGCTVDDVVRRVRTVPLWNGLDRHVVSSRGSPAGPF